ncbi:MAG: SMC-Scp complex subunit ScpB [Labilithrix sp.]|nr:SMC-Scp complex subunit ScpB [Labilithrix sp.]
MGTARESERALLAALATTEIEDVETTVNVTGDMLPFPGRDDLDAPTVALGSEAMAEVDGYIAQRRHLRGLLEALIFASDAPIKPKDLAKLASAQVKQVTELLAELAQDFSTRGIQLEEVAGGWVFRTSPEYAPFIRDLTKQRPVRLTRAQVETLAIIAYRQPVTRPEIDDVRGVDSGPVLKLLLERDLVRILGKRDEPGRPLIYGTTNNFLEFFGLKSLKDLPTLREFTELTDESREAYEDEMGEPPNNAPPLEDARSTRETEDGEDDDERELRESMAVPSGAHDEGGEEPLDDDPHDDGPTIASKAPPAMDEDDADDDDDDDDDADNDDDDDDADDDDDDDDADDDDDDDADDDDDDDDDDADDDDDDDADDDDDDDDADDDADDDDNDDDADDDDDDNDDK